MTASARLARGAAPATARSTDHRARPARPVRGPRPAARPTLHRSASLAAARLGLAVALIATLVLLGWTAPGGFIALAAGVVVVALGLVRPSADPAAPGLLGFVRDLVVELVPIIGACGAAAVLLHGSLGEETPPLLATVARVVALAAIATLPRVGPRLLPLPFAAVILAVAAAAALVGGVDLVSTGLAVFALAVAAQSLAGARSRALRDAASLQAGVGQAPPPLAERANPLPAAVVAIAALLGASLFPAAPPPPAPTRGGDGADGEGGRRGGLASVGGDGSADVDARAVTRRSFVAFHPEVRMDERRGGGLGKTGQIVARVQVRPRPPSLFLRGAALSEVTDSGFFRAKREMAEPPIDDVARREVIVQLLKPQDGYLPVVGRPTEMAVAPAADGTPRSRPRRSAAGYHVPRDPAYPYPLRYSFTSLEAGPGLDPRRLPAQASAELLALPGSVARSVSLRALAAEVVRGESAYDAAAATARWLRSNGVYDDLHPIDAVDLRGRMDAFLLRETRGICVEFAGGMVVLLRLAGVPARMIAGYRVDVATTGGRFTVTSDDAHAWVEVPIAGAGWVTFDPTPARSEASDASNRVASSTVDEDGEGGDGGGGAADGTTETTTEVEEVDPIHAAAVADALASARAKSILRFAFALLALATALATLSARRRLRRAVRATKLGEGAGRIAAEWVGERDRFLGALERRGFRLGGAETPRQLLARIGPPDAERELLERATDLYERLRFSGRADASTRAELGRCLDRLAAVEGGR